MKCFDVVGMTLDAATEVNSLTPNDELSVAFGTYCMMIDKMLEDEDEVDPEFAVDVNEDLTITIDLKCGSANVCSETSILYLIMLGALKSKFYICEGDEPSLGIQFTFPSVWE